MRAKNIYQCDNDCKTCTYERKNPTGFTIMDECGTDVCPLNKEKLGNVDKLGGRHVEGYGWNPLGEFCNMCKHTSCEECIKWSNRDKKLRNNVPPALKKPKPENKPEEIAPIIKDEPKEVNDIVAQAKAIMEKEKNPFAFSENDIFDKPSSKDAPSLDDFDIDDFSDNKNTKTTFEMPNQLVQDTPAQSEMIDAVAEVQPNKVAEETFVSTDTDDEEDSVEIDFGLDIVDNNEEDEYSNVVLPNNDDDDDDIPMPDEYRSEYETDADNDEKDDDNEDTSDDNQSKDDEYDEDDDYEDEDDEDDEYDEDDDAEFDMYEPTKKLKASILFSQGTKIAKYQVRNRGVYLTVEGDAKVTVKGRNDSDGFSYCDPNRFPRYIREGILNGELYENTNIKITDNSHFVIVYFHDIDGEMIEKKRKVCGIDFSIATEEKIRKVLFKALEELNQ